MDIDELLKAKREEILRLAAEHGARNVRLFGSVVRGEAKPNSDVDFLEEPRPVVGAQRPGRNGNRRVG
ncbi:MAG: nucleotidyltransferase domain-containing protein [Acidobacteria bacterium]|nr:nucleotidyltransferase domain-containing protein [Acidobacteriota bacterium]